MRRGDYKMLARGGALSAGLLVLLAIGHTLGWAFLDLDSRWLLVAGVPLLVALIAGGFIRGLKGFGIEIEIGLEEPVPEGAMEKVGDLTVDAADLAEDAEGVMKGSFHRVDVLSEAERQEIRRLGFVMAPSAFYDPGILSDYLSSLPKLRYLEVKDSNGQLQFVIDRVGLPHERTQEFVQALQKGTVGRVFEPWVIRDLLAPTDKLRTVVEKFRGSKAESLPVVVQGRIVASLPRSAVFEKLSDLVLRAG
ncbi:MAG: hypothetical protein GY946_15100 [bacterium]|nr:hypothetical protein [bacterium]